MLHSKPTSRVLKLPLSLIRIEPTGQETRVASIRAHHAAHGDLAERSKLSVCGERVEGAAADGFGDDRFAFGGGVVARVAAFVVVTVEHDGGTCCQAVGHLPAEAFAQVVLLADSGAVFGREVREEGPVDADS